MKPIPDKIKREIEAEAELEADYDKMDYRRGAQWAIEKYALPLVDALEKCNAHMVNTDSIGEIVKQALKPWEDE